MALAGCYSIIIEKNYILKNNSIFFFNANSIPFKRSFKGKNIYNLTLKLLITGLMNCYESDEINLLRNYSIISIEKLEKNFKKKKSSVNEMRL